MAVIKVEQVIIPDHQKTQCWGCGRMTPSGSKMRHIYSRSFDGIWGASSFWCVVCVRLIEENNLENNAYECGELRRNYFSGWRKLRMEMEDGAGAVAYPNP